MKTKMHAIAIALPLALAAGGALVIPTTALATENSGQRQDARDIRQDTRSDSREAKVDCRQADQQSNPECRQDKRDAKQEGRESARDTKY